LRERLIFGEHITSGRKETTGGRKETRKKGRKNITQEENQCGMHTDRPNHVRVRVFEKYCNGYNHIKYYK
jgi:hypothetical protein